MGLIADIQPPSVEMKMAILQKKAELINITLPLDVIEFLASRIRSNIRELEGSLIKLAAYTSLTGTRIDLNMAKEVLKDVFYDESKPLTIEQIQKTVSEFYSIKVVDIKARKRTKEITMPRQVAMYLAKNYTDLSLEDIGKAFGGKGHATVIYACKQVEGRIESDESFKKIIEQLINRIK
ncbi:chromosomal replication initiator protein DnaA [Candidatus Magnetoovum chiemensis]|nr:chromosomal replication initiator protein DnaA [Candidatus Magnetoovum chiemensis]